MRKKMGRCWLFVAPLFILSIFLPLEYAEGKKTAYACEGTNLRLDCDPGRVIRLIRAIYGRFSITICNENGNTDWSVNCGSSKSILVINGTCNYQRSCSVLASTKTFGDPCEGTVKYLEVQYQCILASSLTSTTPRSGGRGTGGWQGESKTSPTSIPTTSKVLLGTSTQSEILSKGINDSAVGRTEIPFDPVSTTTGVSVRGSSSIPTPPVLPEKPVEGDGLPDGPNEYKSWEGREVTEPWDWASQFERKDPDAPAVEPMWSDKLAEKNGNVPSHRPPSSIPTTRHGEHFELEQEMEKHPSFANADVSRELCESKLDRGMFWNWTVVGETAKQACPGGASGLARWKCLRGIGGSPSWFPDSPDLSDCKSAWLLSLQARVLEGDRISNVASDLAQVTSTKQMYGGDIAAAVRIIKTIATRMNDQLRSLTNQVSREDLASELLQLILDAGSNLLEKARLDPWRDLSYADQMKIATDLLVGLEDNAFLLANVVNSEKVVRKSVKNILTTIFAIEANNVGEINFPSEPSDVWGRMGDVLTMPAEALRENSDGGLVRLVCFAYNNLEHVLQPIGPSSGEEGDKEIRKLVNSRVISASLNQGRHIQLALPVQLTLRHLWLDNVSNPQCVFWDYTQDKWSEEGCRVVKTNRTHTMCQCTHLTNFAILMDHQPAPKHLPPPQMLQVILYVGSSVVILCLFLTFVITEFCIEGRVFQTMILKNLLLCMLIVEVVFVLGIHETQRPFLCSSISLIIHYFALASILWLFLHGFHLHLIAVEAAESGLSRQLWYYGVSYGSPAIVVLLSFLLDPRSYRSEEYCFIQTNFALLCFVGPALIVALASVVALVFTSYRVFGLLATMPKKPNDDKAIYLYIGSWLRGSFLILFFLLLTWSLRLLDLESSSTPLSYASGVSLILEGLLILLFHCFKAEDISKVCTCGKRSLAGDSEREMSTQSPEQVEGVRSPSGPSYPDSCHNNHLVGGQKMMDGARLLTLSRHPIDLRGQDGIYAKQLAAAVGLQPSPGMCYAGGISEHQRYAGDSSGILGLYSKGESLEGNWPRGSSYSDIRSVGGFHRADPVYEEIEKPMSSRASVSDLSEDEAHHLYPHNFDIYSRNLYGQQIRGFPHHHHHPNVHKGRKLEVLQGEASNPLLSHQPSPSHYGTRNRATSDHHHHPHVSLKSLHNDEHILQNVHMV